MREASRFSARLRALRRARGLTQTALAERVGSSKSYLSHLESGNQVRPSAELIHNLAQCLDTTYEVLLGYAPLGDPAVDVSVLLRKYTALSVPNRARLCRIADVLADSGGP